MSPLFPHCLHASKPRAPRFHAMTLVGVVVLGLACASAPREIVPQTCAGDKVLVVRNESGAPVDVYAVTGRYEQILGTAGAGRTEMSLAPAPSANSFLARRGRDIVTPRMRVRANDPIKFAVECR